MIYCVEDDSGIRDLMIYTLTIQGFDVRGFQDAGAFWQAMNEKKPELVILDIMLPGEDGISVLKKLRGSDQTKYLPVIMATAKGSEYDRVIGLDLGADDYLCKPFGMMEMVSRIKAVLRRTQREEDTDIRKYRDLILNDKKHLVYVNNREIILTLKEYDLLQLFMENIGMVFTRSQLLDRIWDSEFTGATRTVDVHIGTLRTKLGTAGDYIQTVRGVGYKME